MPWHKTFFYLIHVVVCLVYLACVIPPFTIMDIIMSGVALTFLYIFHFSTAVNSGCGNDRFISPNKQQWISHSNKTAEANPLSLISTSYINTHKINLATVADVTPGVGDWRLFVSHPRFGTAPMPVTSCTWRFTSLPDKYIAITIVEFGNLLCHSSVSVYVSVDKDNKQVCELKYICRWK